MAVPRTLCVLTTYFVIVKTSYRNVTCGVDKSPVDVTYEGVASIETYPWLGYLVYPIGNKRLTTVVALVTKQIVLGTATEIDNLPKTDFRARARVVLGHSCFGQQYRVRDYTFHPDFGSRSISALAMIQLNLDDVNPGKLHPLCPPPAHFIDPEFYAMTLSYDCNNPQVRVYEMKYVDPEQCKTYYRRSGLDIDSIWPTHTACARARHGGECLWRSGTVLVVRQGRRWHLVGFGVHGPGCEAPARFMDYGMYHQWVRESVLRIGRPTITKVRDNLIILRRSLSNLQRYGNCDNEEMENELYSEYTSIKTKKVGMRKVRYNVTIYANIEYSCVVFRAQNFDESDRSPHVRLRRWCAGPMDICSEHQHIQIDFYVEINFYGHGSYEMIAYGTEAKVVDPRFCMSYINNFTNPEHIPNLFDIKGLVKLQVIPWYTDEKSSKEGTTNHPDIENTTEPQEESSTIEESTTAEDTTVIEVSSTTEEITTTVESITIKDTTTIPST